MKRSITALVAVTLMVIAGCSSAPKAPEPVMAAPKVVMSNVPDWYVTVPPAPAGYVYAAGTAVSRDLSMSKAKAHLDAEVQLANRIAAEVSTMMKDYRRDAGDDFAQVTEMVTNKTAARVKLAAKTDRTIILTEGGGFRTYVLLLSSDLNVAALQADKNAAERELAMRTN
jgi:PBP1b-binding outer membrane lipoprotein LpoB